MRHILVIWTEEQVRMLLFSSSKRQFQRQFSTLYDRIYRYCAMRLPTVDDRDDVVSETLLSAWERLSSFDAKKGEMAGWVIGIARHKIADYWRRRRFVLEGDDMMLDLPAVESGERTMKYVDDLLSFNQLMRDLPQDAKALLTLRHVDGLSHEEIAEMLDRSPAAVRQALSRLHRKLRKDFADYE